jgi:hypothetical protein
LHRFKEGSKDTFFFKIIPILSVFDQNQHFKHALFSIFMLTLLISYVKDKIFSHIILSILRICENLILVDMNKFGGIYLFFGGENLLGAVSILLGVFSTFWTTVPFNWGHDSNF